MSTNKTTSFIKKSMLINGEHYDYSKVEYKNCDTNVILICKIHGEFVQTPYSHLKSKNCPRCRGHQKTTKQFIEESILIHGDKYDYSKVDYKNSTSKVIIICRFHGEIQQMPSSHLCGQGCYKCGNNTLKTKEEFINDSKKIFGDKYHYSKVEYKGAHKKVIISCREHGDFEIKPNCHLSNQGCYKCGRNQVSVKLSSNKEDFIKKSIEVHGDKYDYSKVDYNGNKKKVIIICNYHGEFLQKPNGHLSGNGCIDCAIIINADRNRKTLEQFITEARQVHGDKYDYSKVEYLNSREKIIIICKNHGEFLQSPEDHTHSIAGCPRCINKTEGKFYNIMIKIYPEIIEQFKVEWCKNKRYDFCIQKHKIIIELDGPQHFRQISNWSTPEEQFKNDKFKEECANNNGYSIIRILQEDVLNDTYDWLNYLCKTIEEIINNNKITNVYLCKGNEYNAY
jgi:very-short-patch-repair endonuclease